MSLTKYSYGTSPYFAGKLMAGSMFAKYGYPPIVRPSSIYPSRATGVSLVRRRKIYRKKRTFRNQMLKNVPANHYTGEASTNLFHNTLYTFVPTTGIVQGTTNQTRVGDSIELAALKLKGFFQSTTSPNCFTYRIIVGFTGEEYNFPTTFGIGLTTTELYQPNTFTSWFPNGVINPKAFTVLYDQVIDSNSQISGSPDINSYECTIPINQHFPYQSQGSIYGKTKNLVVIVMGAVQGGTAGTTAAGAAYCGYDLIFKDP